MNQVFFSTANTDMKRLPGIYWYKNNVLTHLYKILWYFTIYADFGKNAVKYGMIAPSCVWLWCEYL